MTDNCGNCASIGGNCEGCIVYTKWKTMLYTDSAKSEINTLKAEVKLQKRYVEQLKGDFVKICKIKNILEEKNEGKTYEK